MWPQFSPLSHVNEAVIREIVCMRRNPYSPMERVEQGTMTLPDLIEKIRFRFGDRAAKSVRITVH